MPTEIQQDPMRNIMESSVCLILNRRYIGVSKSVRSSKVETDADKRWISISKTLLDNKELKAIWDEDGKVNALLNLYCLPSLFKRGIYLVPIKLVPEVDKILTEHADKRAKLVLAFKESYNTAVAAAAERLGSLYNPADYLPVESVEGSFQFSWKYFEFGVSQVLKQVSAQMFEREQEKAAEHWVEVNEAIQQLLRASMHELVSHLTERLSPAADGKKKIFKESSLTNIQAFLSTFDARNIANDQELAALVEQTKKLTAGITAEEIRSNDDLRNSIKTGFTNIKTSLDTMITVAPVRKIEL